MTAVVREKWLILDDCATDRRRMVLAIQDEAIEPVCASTVSEAQEILERGKFGVCILDFFLRGTSSRNLISSIRKQFPAMLIIVVSSYAGKEESIYRAGADEVIPKVSDLDAFATVVRNAVAHARSLRGAKVASVSRLSLRMTPSLKRDFKTVVSSSGGNVLIISEPGMGRTAVARALGEELLRVPLSTPTNEILTQKSILTFTCSPEETFESVDSALFGAVGGDAGLVAAAQNGVLLIEEAQHLPRQMQEKLKKFVLLRKAKSNNGALISPSSVRFLFTSLSQTDGSSIWEGFQKSVTPLVISIPPFSEMLRESRQIIEFFFARESQRRVKPEKGLVREIMDRVQASCTQVTLRSLSHAIELACGRAASEGRDLVLVSDFESFEDLYDPNVGIVPKDLRQLLLASDDQVGITPWLQLYEIARSGNMAEAEELLRKMMVEYALIRYKGNKTKMANQLGVARQHLYKPCLRGLHLSDHQSANV